MPLIFAYGTLQEESVQQSIFGRPLGGESDELPGFELSIAMSESGSTPHANL
jgi:hypothetical protein